MLRHAVIAIVLFLGIAALTYFIAQRPELPPAPLPPMVASVPDVAIRLMPSGDFLPRSALPEMTVETPVSKVVARFYRVADPALLLRLYRGATQDSLSSLAVARLLDDNIKPIHIAELAVKNGRATLAWNGVAATTPGFYAVTLAPSLRAPAFAASWFMRNDLLILAAEDRESWHVSCQDLASGAPRSDVRLTWLGLDNAAPLAQADCGAKGQLSLAKSSLEQNSVPLLVWAEDKQGQLAFVPLRTIRLPPDDRNALTMLTTDRQHYLPGQTVRVLAAHLEEKAENLRIGLVRPDGLQIAETIPTELNQGVGWGQFVLPNDAMPGRWHIVTHSKDSVAHDTVFQVGQDSPQGQSRLKLVLRDDARVTLMPVLLDAHGNAMSDQAASITLRWEPVRLFPELAAGYVFGGLDAGMSEPFKLANLVVKPGSTVSLTLPPPPKTDTPLQARLELQPLGLPEVVAQPLLLRFPPVPWALGIKAEFAPDSLHGNSQANFRVNLLATVKKEAKAVLPKVNYELLTERRSFRWFFADGSWRYESDVAVAPVLSGTITPGDDRTGMISVGVQPGQYRLEAFTPDRKLLTSWRFNVAPALRIPPLRHLPVVAARNEKGSINLAPLASGSRAVIAAGQTIQEFRPTAQATELKLAAALSQGGHVVVIGAEKDNAGEWYLAGARHWVTPQTYPDLQGTTLKLPDRINAGSTTTITLQLPPEPKRKRYLQLIAIPLDAKAAPRPLLKMLQQERDIAFSVTSNIPADWPQTASTEATPQPPISDESLSSPMIVVPPDGFVTLDMAMPKRTNKAALHLLVWDDATIGEHFQEITLQMAPNVPAPAAVGTMSTPIPPLPQAWRFACLPPLQNGQSGLLTPPHDKTLSLRPVVMLAPLPLPDIGQMLGQLWAAGTNRSDVLARSLLALQAYHALLETLGVSSAQFSAWQTQIITALVSRQRGDGGIALYDDAPQSDLTASAFSLLAWQAVPENPLAQERQHALLEYILRRLDVAWGAETELFARCDAFYALGLLGKIDPAALRYFVEKYGNTIRHAVFEAELAAALANIGDMEQGQQFALRAMAQLPAMRIEQPQNALQVLQILVHHDLVQAQEALALLPDTAALSPPRLTLAAVTGAQLWPDLASRLPAWQAQLESESLTLRGLVGKRVNPKRASKLHNKGEQTIYACMATGGTENKIKQESPALSQTLLKRQIFSTQGRPLKLAQLALDNEYVIVLSASEVTAGPAEFLLSLPPELTLRAVVPGSPIVGHYSWLKEIDQVQAYRTTPEGLVLALNRPTAGTLKLALTVKASGKGKMIWPAPHMAQFNVTRTGTDEILTIE